MQTPGLLIADPLPVSQKLRSLRRQVIFLNFFVCGWKASCQTRWLKSRSYGCRAQILAKNDGFQSYSRERVLVVQCFYGAHSIGFCLNFWVKTKHFKKLHFLRFWAVAKGSAMALYTEIERTDMRILSFSPLWLIFVRRFKCFWALLFYSKRKV